MSDLIIYSIEVLAVGGLSCMVLREIVIAAIPSDPKLDYAD